MRQKPFHNGKLIWLSHISYYSAEVQNLSSVRFPCKYVSPPQRGKGNLASVFENKVLSLKLLTAGVYLSRRQV